MGFFDRILKKVRPLVVHDDFFGRLTYMKVPKGCTPYWEGRRIFAPTGLEVELFLDAPGEELPPSDAQRGFFLTVERRYASILSHAEADALYTKVLQSLIAKVKTPS